MQSPFRYFNSSPEVIGETVHKGVAHPGEHDPIIAMDLWDRVQASLIEKAARHEKGTTQKEPSLLRGLLFDDGGNRMSPSGIVRLTGSEQEKP